MCCYIFLLTKYQLHHKKLLSPSPFSKNNTIIKKKMLENFENLYQKGKKTYLVCVVNVRGLLQRLLTVGFLYEVGFYLLVGVLHNQVHNLGVVVLRIRN
jgi:hypothetical protein